MSVRVNIAALLRATLKAQASAASHRGQTPAQTAEWLLCSPAHGPQGFIRFCERHLKIQDKKTKRIVPFVLFPGQRRIVPALVRGEWLLILKGRQVGFTWLLSAYCLWRLTYEPMFQVLVVNQEKIYADDFVARVVFMHGRCEPWMVCTPTTDAMSMIRFQGGEHNTELRSMVGSENAARSTTADLVIADEASRVPFFDKLIGAAVPALTSAGGQLICLTTSAGPQGTFYELWQENYGRFGEKLRPDGRGAGDFTPVFVHWSERPGRDAAWYAAEKRRLDQVGPVVVKQEYPDTPEEAWEFATGRIYARFRTDTHIRRLDVDRSTDEFYRCIDWGQSESALVCLWVMHRKGPTGLVVSPDCPQTIREMLAYRWDEKKPDEVLKKDDHTCDALRYLIVTNMHLSGLLYVYRELYIEGASDKEMSVAKFIAAIHEASGWEVAPPDSRRRWVRGREGEAYVDTVCDRAWPLVINDLNDCDIPARGHSVIKRVGGLDASTDSRVQEVKEGIERVRLFVDGTFAIEKFLPPRAVDQAMAALREERQAPWATTGLEKRRLAQAARAILRQRRRS